MKLSVDIDYRFHLDEEFLAGVRDAGFRFVSISHLHGDALTGDDWRRDVDQTGNLLARLGLSCVQTHLPSYPILSSSEEYDDALQERVKRALEAAHILGARWGAYHPRTSMKYNYDTQRAYQDNREQIGEFLETCEMFNVGLAIENLPIFPDCPQYKFYTANTEDLIRLTDSFGSNRIGVCWDTGHANLMASSQVSSIRALGKRIKIVHIHSNNRMYDDHLPPSLGTVDWPSVMSALEKTDYGGSVALEVVCAANPTIGSYYRHCYDSAVMLEELCRNGDTKTA